MLPVHYPTTLSCFSLKEFTNQLLNLPFKFNYTVIPRLIKGAILVIF